MRKCVLAAMAALALLLGPATAHATTTTETLVFMRHGEKPSGGYGELTCQGLQRSLQLPDVLIGRYGKAKWVYAPNPSAKISDPAGSFYYVRPLATIEPAVIRLGISVNTSVAYYDVSSLNSLLLRSTKAADTIYIAWEHAYLVAAVQAIMNKYGGGYAVPAWQTGDYDSLYVVHVTWTDGVITSAHFQHDYEGLNNLSTSCP
jgi:hypothetical protein